MGIRYAAAPLALAAVLLFAGCASGVQGEGSAGADAGASGQAAPAPAALPAPEEALQKIGLSANDPRGIIDALDAMPLSERPTDLMVSVLPDALRVQPDQPDELVLPLESGDFYVSIAPYRETTHPCTFHSLTTCVGEMRSADIALRITDPATGEVLVDRATRTADNGFIGVWLPVKRQLEVEITSGSGADAAVGRATIATGPGDPTCITTLQLSPQA